MISVLLILFFLIAAAFFEGAETSLLAMSEVRLQTLARNGNAAAITALDLRKHVRRLFGTLLMGQTVCDIAAATLATLVAHDALGDSGAFVETVMMTVIVLIFVNLIPKSHAAANPEAWVTAVAGPVRVLTRALGPLVNAIDRFAALFVPGAGSEVRVTEEEIRTMTRMGVKTGDVERGEKELIDRVFLFNDITAADVLTPREVMVSLGADRPLGEALAAINNQRFSRYPVLDENGRVIGIVHIKDLLAKLQSPNAATVTVRDCMIPPVFVHDTALIDDLFRELTRRQIHMAIALDSAERVVGVLTLEDLLEELVGEISDESDVDERVFKRLDKQNVLVHGDTDIGDVNRFFTTRIDAGAERTIGRLVRKRARHAVKQGETVTIIDGVLTATAEEVKRGRVLKVRLTKLPAPAPAPET